MDLHPDLSDLLAAFAAAEVRYALLGGYAVAYYGKPRATKDLDLLVSVRTPTSGTHADIGDDPIHSSNASDEVRMKRAVISAEDREGARPAART